MLSIRKEGTIVGGKGIGSVIICVLCIEKGAGCSGIEADSGDQSARSAENFPPSFCSYWDGLSLHLSALY